MTPRLSASFTLRSSALLAALGLLLAAGPGADRAAAACPPDAGIEDVGVALIDLDDDGNPDINGDDKERNEQARISSSLAGKLGVTLPVDPDVLPQIRVLTENQAILNGGPGTGVFSIFEIYPDSVDEIQIWADEDPLDEASGEYRLFAGAAIADLGTEEVIAFAQAPSTTTVHHGGVITTVDEHFCEPHADSTFTEELTLTSDRRLALLVPHGGEIEFGTSEQIDSITSTLAGSWSVSANTWDLRGYWHNDENEDAHWHVTSKDLSAGGFPGFAEMLAQPTFDDQRWFQYVASLHGMDYDAEGMVLGGRGHREAKCLIASRVRERMVSEGLPVPAAYIWNYDEDLGESIEVAHSDPTVPTITAERGNDPGLKGTSTSNLVNSLSPNAYGEHGFGGFQIEQSPDLRDDDPLPQFLPALISYRDLVAEEIANALGELVSKPGLITPSSTAICDALEADQPAPTAEIHGRLFWDDDGDEAESAGDRPVAFMPMQLLDATATVIDTTETGTEGRYSFAGLAAGTYSVRVDASAAIDFVAEGVPASEAVDSDVDPLTGTTGAIVLQPHQVAGDIDAGLVLAAGNASLGDRAWVDSPFNGLPANGIQDAGESGLPGVKVELFDVAGVLIATQLTDGGGYYSFGNLPAGTWGLHFSTPPGYQPTSQGAGTDPSLDSDIDADGDLVTTLGSGTTELDLDAGFALACQQGVKLVAFGSEWKWSDTFYLNWHAPKFLSPIWSEAQAPLGYGMDVESAIHDGGTVSYFRLGFEIEDPSILGALDLSLLRKDGAVVYLNGQEVLRSNVPAGSIGSGTQTIQATVGAPNLVTGTNVLAVEVHERGDDELIFDLEVSAEICAPCVRRRFLTADRVTYLREESTKNRGDEESAEMERDEPSDDKNALFAWNTSSLPGDAEILHAAVEWRVTNTSDDTFHLYPLLADWNEDSAHWFQAEGGLGYSPWSADGATDPVADYEGDQPLASLLFHDDPPFDDPPYTGLLVLNLNGRQLVQDWVRGERPNHGFIIPGEGENKLEVDSDDGLQPPVLEVVYRSCAQ